MVLVGKVFRKSHLSYLMSTRVNVFHFFSLFVDYCETIMPESPDTKAPHQVTSPTSMAGGTSTGVRDVSRPQSGNNAGTLTL